MKKIVLALSLGLGAVFASDMDIKGLITGVDDASKTITINGFVVQILPQTKVKLDDCGMFGTDVAGKFVDLKQGSFAEAEVYPSTPNMPNTGATPTYTAKEVEVKCVKNSAY